MPLDQVTLAFALFGVAVFVASVVYVVGKTALYIGSAVLEKAKSDLRKKG